MRGIFQAQSEGLGRQTEADVERVTASAIALIGAEKPIKGVSNEDIRGVRECLASLPANYMKAAKNKGMNLKAMIDANANVNANVATLSVKSQDKYLTMFRGLFIWAEAEGILDKVPGKGIKVAGLAKLAASERRTPYSIEQLALIFRSPLYNGSNVSCSDISRGAQ